MGSREEIALALALRRAARRVCGCGNPLWAAICRWSEEARRSAAAREAPPPELAPLVALAIGYPDAESFGAELGRRSPMPTADPEAAFRAALQGCYGGQGAIDGASMVPLDRMPAWALEEAFGTVPESLDVFRAGYGDRIEPGRYVSTDPSHARLFMRPGMRLLRMDAVPPSHLRAMGPGRIVGRLRGTDREGPELVYWPPGAEAREAPQMTLGEFWGRYAGPPAGRRGSTYFDIGHRVGAETVLWAWLRGRVLTRTITNRRSTETSRSDWEEIHEDMPWPMSDARAKGRVDPSAGTGSIVFETSSRVLQLRIADALVEEFPGIRWSVFSGADSTPLQEFCESRIARCLCLDRAPKGGAGAGGKLGGDQEGGGWSPVLLAAARV